MEVTMVAVRLQYFVTEVRDLSLQLLHAYNVSALQREPAEKSFGRG
jgi:hypothetical protein